MNKIQKVNFRNIDDFLDYLPEEERKITLFLRNIVFDCITDCTEKLAYNVPFYYRHQRICYIWPASIPWGGIKSGVAIGFTKGYLLSNPGNYLAGTEKKEIRVKTFLKTSEIHVELLKDLLFEAAMIDDKIKKEGVE